MLGKNQSAQALTATSSRTEAFLKTPGVALGLGRLLSLPVDRGVSQAHDHASNGAQKSSRFWSAHSALIFPQRHNWQPESTEGRRTQMTDMTSSVLVKVLRKSTIPIDYEVFATHRCAFQPH